jgi:hypothetical protein
MNRAAVPSDAALPRMSRKMLVALLGLALAAGIAACGTASGATDFASRYCNATYGQLIANGGGPLGGDKNAYMSQCHYNITSGNVSMDPTIVYDLNNHLPVSPTD